ncbi:ribosomal protein L7/L12 [Paenibacillus sp. MMS20-IR301]|uniref:ribosomal protein L7/L12 n=1 Tax=Paenibacillus sp. MMS20-IR301 TaxID=2895946 RepID=UPI0028ED75ED|nr:ribosomal protein L7/L12 [Paenibacillus sp. MMS20-IR301]WNS45137.1 ribosomal protein L7/L12 [Paenibacillus sp. MMS20-IR301]
MENADIIAISALSLAFILMLSVFRLKKRVTELEVQLQQQHAYGGAGGGMGAASSTGSPTPLNVHNLEIAPDLERRLYLLLAEGKKIQAVKVMREARNLSLRDAKEFVDKLERSGSFR